MPKGIVDAFALENLNWLQAIRDGKPVVMSGEEGTIDLALSYAILESGLLGQSVTLEPGGQIELSGAPLANLHVSLLDKLGAPVEQIGDSTGPLRGLSHGMGAERLTGI